MRALVVIAALTWCTVARAQTVMSRVAADTFRVLPATDSATAATLSPTKAATLRGAPDGESLAIISAGASLRPMARDRGWVRVELHGWMREAELAVADSTIQAALSAADLRADPEGTRGATVRWEVQILSTVQRADPLRKGLATDEPYVLARGPRAEGALLYLAVPPSLLSSVRAITPLEGAVITARVRTGRSEPVGVPVLDLQSIVKH